MKLMKEIQEENDASSISVRYGKGPTNVFYKRKKSQSRRLPKAPSRPSPLSTVYINIDKDKFKQIA